MSMLRCCHRLSVASVMLALVAGCASTKNNAPVVERSVGPRPVEKTATPAESPAKPLPGAENAGKPGYYAVRPGDTLIRIGLDNGQNWRDIVRWNGIDNPNLIEVGQVLRVVPPNVDAGAVVSRPVAAARTDARALDAKPAAAVAAGSASSPAAAAASAVAPSTAAPSAPAAAREPDDDVNWQWPAGGAIGGNFEEGRSKGVAILGKAGDPVLAAADGRVVYAGSGLRGYGNLVIVKHNATYLTAYAHNQTLLVKEDQAVRRGQKIAEMGASDADRVQLHFEVRRLGKPIDPLKVLPAR
jgi:lipoprotein NlpD